MLQSVKNIFIDALLNTILKFILLTTLTNSNCPPWVSGVFKKLIHIKNKANAPFKSSFHHLDYHVFSKFCAKYKNISRTFYKDFIKKVESILTYNPKKFWDFTRKSRSISTVSKIVSLNNQSSCNIRVDLFLFLCIPLYLLVWTCSPLIYYSMIYPTMYIPPLIMYSKNYPLCVMLLLLTLMVFWVRLSISLEILSPTHYSSFTIVSRRRNFPGNF